MDETFYASIAEQRDVSFHKKRTTIGHRIVTPVMRHIYILNSNLAIKSRNVGHDPKQGNQHFQQSAHV